MTDPVVAQINDNPYKADFPILAANPEKLTWTALLSQRPRAVIEAQSSFYETMNANALRGFIVGVVEATAAIEGLALHLVKFIELSIKTASQKTSRLFLRATLRGA